MKGFSLLEVLVALAIMAVSSAIALPLYSDYVERARQSDAGSDLMLMDMGIERFVSENFNLPDNLAEVGLAGMTDPWGQPYAYLRIDGGGNVQGKVRKDKNLNPINSDFDLYSVGRDGATVSPLTAKKSHDDVVRAGNGSFFGVAVNF